MVKKLTCSTKQLRRYLEYKKNVFNEQKSLMRLNAEKREKTTAAGGTVIDAAGQSVFTRKEETKQGNIQNHKKGHF